MRQTIYLLSILLKNFHNKYTKFKCDEVLIGSRDEVIINCKYIFSGNEGLIVLNMFEIFKTIHKIKM